MNQEQQGSQAQPMDGKTIAIISYITIIGWVIAYIQFGKNKSSLAAFHLRQTLLLMLCGLGVYVVQMIFLFIPYIGGLISMLFSLSMLGFLVLWVIGLIAAINGEEKPMPLFGNKAQEIFKGIQ